MAKKYEWGWAWMLPILLLSVFLTAPHLGTNMVWFDEWFSYGMAGTGLFDQPGAGYMFETPDLPPLAVTLVLAASDRWPPAYFVLLQVWDAVSDGALYIDRTLSLFLGLIALSIIYRLAKLLYGSQVSLVAALLTATSAFFVYYAHELRPYTLYLLAAVAMLWTYSLLQSPAHHHRRWVRWSFGISITTILYTHYVGAVFVLGLGIYHLLTQPAGVLRSMNEMAQRWRVTTRIAINAMVAYLPWAFFFIASLTNEAGDVRGESIATILMELGISLSNDVWWLLVLLLILAIPRLRAPHTRLLLAWAAISLLLALIGNIFVNFLSFARYLLPLLPVAIVLLASGIQRLYDIRPAFAGVAIGLWIMSGIGLITQGIESTLPDNSAMMRVETLDTIIEVTAGCVVGDDYVVLSGGPSHATSLRDDVLIDYLNEYTLNIAQLGVLVTNDSDAFSWLLPPAIQVPEVPFSERIAYITAAGGDVWLFIARETTDHDESLRRFQALMTQEGYSTTGPFIERPDLLVYRYTLDGLSLVDTSCALS